MRCKKESITDSFVVFRYPKLSPPYKPSRPRWTSNFISQTSPTHGRIGKNCRWVAHTRFRIGNRRVVAAECPAHQMLGLSFIYEVRRSLLSLGCDTVLTNGG